MNAVEKLDAVRDAVDEWVLNRATPVQVFERIYELIGVREHDDDV